MSTYDKHDRVGYDATDKELMEALEQLHAQHPKVARKVQQRVHEGILQRLKEEGTRRCHMLLTYLERCANEQGPQSPSICSAQRDAVNECFRSVHTEENYQKLRLQMLRGELLQQHAQNVVRKIEMYKMHSPENISEWKPDYAWRYKNLADRLVSQNELDGPGVQTGPEGGQGNAVAFRAAEEGGKVTMPSTAQPGAVMHHVDSLDAMRTLQKQNAQVQQFRRNISGPLTPIPPEFSGENDQPNV